MSTKSAKRASKSSVFTAIAAVIFLIGYDFCSLRSKTIFDTSIPIHGAVETLTGVILIGIWTLRKSL
jgi:hypothetical protein